VAVSINADNTRMAYSEELLDYLGKWGAAAR